MTQQSRAPELRTHTVRKWVVVGCVVVALSLLVAATTTHSAAATVRAPNCRSSFDPYSYSQPTVSACGYKTFARTAVKPLPGGGFGYYYDMNGATVEFLVPPAGFRPSTATSAQLQEYGIPARPANPGDLARWQAEVSRSQPSSPPPFLAETHAHADTVYTYNWAGYAVTGSAGTFTHAEAWYYEPEFGGSRCSTNSDVTWAGIGGYYSGSSALGQIGTAHGVPGVGNHQAWWEVYPYNNITPISLYGHIGGYLVDASAAWVGSGGFYAFYIKDYYSGNYLAFREYINHFDGRSAEAITERPSINGSFSNLSNFGTLTVNSSQANGQGINNYSPNGVRHGVHMIDTSGTDMADPSTIGSNGYFTVSQHSCS